MEQLRSLHGGVQSAEALSKIATLQTELNSAKTKISSIETQLNNLKNSKATTSAWGLSKVTTATDVTNSNSGLVLSAIEKNASVSGSLARQISETNILLEENTYQLSGGIRITLNSNLNDIKKIGNYYCPSDSETTTLINCPTYGAFVMKVDSPVGGKSNYVSQTIRDYLSGNIYYRLYTYTGEWLKWRKIESKEI